MKKKSLLITLSAGMAFVTLSSNDNGAANNSNGDRTGRIGASVTCASAGCHSGGSGTTTCTIEVRKKSAPTGAIVTDFTPDSVYIVKLKGTNASLSHYGFQVIAVNGSANAGTWQNIPTDAHTGTAGGLTLVEHHHPLPKNGSGNYEIDLEWKASNVSTTTFHAIINGVNNTGSTSGDLSSSPTQVTLQKKTSVENTSLQSQFSVYPNPATNVVNVKIENITPGEAYINVVDLRGKIIASQNVSVSNSSINTTINSARWAAGLYYIHISKNDESKVIAIVKQ